MAPVHQAATLRPSQVSIDRLCRRFLRGRPTHGGVIYVSNGLNSSVTAYSTTGGIVDSFPVDPFANPEGLVFDSNGNLYVAEDGNHIVLKIAPNGSMSTFVSGLESPGGLAFDRQGNLFASDTSTGEISKITPGGSVTTFVSALALHDPHESFGLAFDANGNLFDAAPQVNSIFEITPSGSVSTFATMDSPEGLAFDGNGNLYASSLDDGTITKITPSGNKSIFATGVVGPIGIAFDSGGNLFVAEHTLIGSIAEVSPSGVVTTLVASTGGDPNWIAIPVPEPSSLTLITLALTLFWGARSVVRKRLSA